MKVKPYQVVSADKWSSLTKENHLEQLLIDKVIPKESKERLYSLPGDIQEDSDIVGCIIPIGVSHQKVWLTLEEFNKIINK